MTHLTVDKMPRLDIVFPESDGTMYLANIPRRATVNQVIEHVTVTRPATGIYLSPQTYLSLRLILAPPLKAMHVQPLLNEEGLMVRAAIEIRGVPVLEDDLQRDGFVAWTEAPRERKH